MHANATSYLVRMFILVQLAFTPIPIRQPQNPAATEIQSWCLLLGVANLAVTPGAATLKEIRDTCGS